MDTKKQIIFYGELFALILFITGHFTDWENLMMLVASIVMSVCAILTLTLWKTITWFQRVCNIIILIICVVLITSLIKLI